MFAQICSGTSHEQSHTAKLKCILLQKRVKYCTYRYSAILPNKRAIKWAKNFWPTVILELSGLVEFCGPWTVAHFAQSIIQRWVTHDREAVWNTKVFWIKVSSKLHKLTHSSDNISCPLMYLRPLSIPALHTLSKPTSIFICKHEWNACLCTWCRWCHFIYMLNTCKWNIIHLILPLNVAHIWNTFSISTPSSSIFTTKST